jgi:iron(III) transport system substrate-binding protein
MGEEKGLSYFQKLAAMKPSIRSGHTLMAELVAAGEITMALDAHVQGVARLKTKGAPIEWKPLQPAFGQPSSVGVAHRAPHPHAALLFADFTLSKEGQEIIKARNRVPSSRAVGSPLNKFDYRLIDPVIVLDEWGQWEKRWSTLFLKGQPVKKDAD